MSQVIVTALVVLISVLLGYALGAARNDRNE